MHMFGMYPLKLNLQISTKTKHGSLQPSLKEGRQLTPNGCLKSRHKLIEPSTYAGFNLLFKDIFKFLVFIIQKHFH